MATRTDIRNLAIIAHVDHGKTTLVDALLQSAGAFRRGDDRRERAMDSGDLERERGITIVSKATSLFHHDTRINLVDTPGHADFGGEVERVLNMVDAVLLVVDAFDGPMPQTRFVTKKAIERGLKIVVVINKIDRQGCQPHKAVDSVFDLLIDLEASEDQQDFPVIFCSARESYAMLDPDGDKLDISAILDLIIERVPSPKVDVDGPLAMWVSTLAHDSFLGFLAIGRIESGRVAVGDRLALIRPPTNGETHVSQHCVESFRVSKLLQFQGVARFEVQNAQAGDIVGVVGMETLEVGDTVTCDAVEQRRAFPMIVVDPPTLSVRFRVNDGPFAGKEGKWVTSRKVGERLFREAQSNVALHVQNGESPEEFEVSGRGELHLSVLMETMRREGYEFCVSPPKVIYRRDDKGQLLEPYEQVLIECDSEFSGAVIDELGSRLAQMTAMEDAGPSRSKMQFRVPARGLIGYRTQLLTATKGTGIMSTIFDGYGKYNGPRKSRARGVLVVMNTGETVTYSLHRVEKRGILFIGPQTSVYAGMICGENAREEDLLVNPCIAKKLTNVRASGTDEKLFLTPYKAISLEQALAFIEDDELIEVTPVNLRLRKRELDHNRRRSHAKQQAMAVE